MSQKNVEEEYEKLTIDVHNHIFTKDTMKAFQKTMSQEAINEFLKNPDRKKFWENQLTAEERAHKTVEEMKQSQIQQVLLMSFNFDFESAYTAHKLYPKEFPGIIPFVDPRYNEPDVLEDYKKRGAVAVKFFPGFWHDFGFNDEKVFPFLEKCLELELVPLIHFGVVKGPNDPKIWPANPLELKPWLTNPKLKDQKYILAHFGAGYLREILMMAYAHKNRLYVDTSGSNDWIFWSPWNNLTQVFEKTILALSPQHILFGSDSGLLPIRHDVVLRQKGILQDLVTRNVITDKDRWDILGNNTNKLLLKQK